MFPLQAAACEGRQETVKLLLDRGAVVSHSVARKYNTPLLHGPFAPGNQALVQLLLIPAAVVLVNAPDCLARIPIHLAATNGNVNMLQIL
jgi:ankyrin repeat protein